MGFIILLIVGGLIGWVASMIMHTNAQQGILLNVIVGIVGAFVADFLIAPLLNVASILKGSYTLSSILVSLLGAVILLAVVKLLRR